MARPTKRNDVLIEVIRRVLLVGNSRTTAARSAGIDRDTFRRWYGAGARAAEKTRKEGEDALDDQEAEMLGFFRMVEESEVHAEMGHVGNIVEASKTDWRASAHWLRCRRPDEWSPNRQFTDLSTPTTHTSPIILIPDNGRNPHLLTNTRVEDDDDDD